MKIEIGIIAISNVCSFKNYIPHSISMQPNSGMQFLNPTSLLAMEKEPMEFRSPGTNWWKINFIPESVGSSKSII